MPQPIRPQDLKNKRIRSHGREVKADCPYCEAPGKLYVNTVRGLYFCQRCHAKGKITGQIVKDVFGEITEKPREPEPLPHICESVSIVPRAYDYLVNRHIIPRPDWVFCAYGQYSDRILMPVVFREKYFGFIARSIRQDEPRRYLTSKGFPTSKILWGFDQVQETITICEGIFDASCFPNGVATFTCRLSSRQAGAISSKCSGVEIAYDQGVIKPVIEAGYHLFEYGIYNVQVLLLPEKDANDCVRKGIDLSTVERVSIWNLIRRA